MIYTIATKNLLDYLDRMFKKQEKTLVLSSFPMVKIKVRKPRFYLKKDEDIMGLELEYKLFKENIRVKYEKIVIEITNVPKELKDNEIEKAGIYLSKELHKKIEERIKEVLDE